MFGEQIFAQLRTGLTLSSFPVRRTWHVLPFVLLLLDLYQSVDPFCTWARLSKAGGSLSSSTSWLLLYSDILCSRADSLRSHVILYEWLAFYSAFLNIHPKVVYLQRWHGLSHMIKLLPCRRGLCTPYNHAPCHFMQSHIRNAVHVYLTVTCHLHLWQNYRDLLRVSCGNTGVAWNAGYRNKCQHRKLALETKLLSPLLQVPFLQLIQKLAWYQQKCHPLSRPPSSSAIAGPAASPSNRISASPSSIELLIVIHGGWGWGLWDSPLSFRSRLWGESSEEERQLVAMSSGPAWCGFLCPVCYW